MNANEIIIADLLPTRLEDAILQTDLCRMTGLDSTTLKQKIQAERLEGALIGSLKHGGYYLAESQEELADFYQMMEVQAKTRLAVISAMKNGAKKEHGELDA